MADTKGGTTAGTQKREEQQRGLARRSEGGGLSRWESPFGLGSPFEWTDRMSEEMDRLFDRFARDAGMPRRSWLSRPFSGGSGTGAMWMPRVEAWQKGDTFTLKADLPGLKKEDVEVDVTEEAITIRGERKHEHEEDREGYWHSEREYGSFQRTIPLPEGAIADSAKATFRDGVLEITMQTAPPEANRGRKIEITDGSEGTQKR